MGNNTPSPEPLIYFSLIHSFMYVCRSPQKGALLRTYGEKYKVTVHGAPRKRKAYIQWCRALLCLPQCHAAFGTIPSTLAWVDQSLISQRVTVTLNTVTPARYCLPRNPEV